jgi:hypothetical protein
MHPATPPHVPSTAPAPRATELMLSPLAIVGAWVLLVVWGELWPGLAALTDRLAFAGEVALVTLGVHALHELGHVLAGFAVRLPFSRVTLGLVTIEREGPTGVARLRLNRSWRRVAGCVERDVEPAPGLREALTVTALGGPLASLVGGAALLAAPGPLSGIGYVSLLVGLVNALPFTLLGQQSDGMLVWRLWSARPTDVAWRAAFCEPRAAEQPRTVTG